MTLKDKVVLVTGASSGIGKATAIRFAEEGAKVVVTYRNNEDGGKDTLAKVKEHSEGILVKADISNPTDIKQLFKTAIDRYSTLDILINNAAITNDFFEFMDASYEEMHKVVNTDILGVLMSSQAAARIMLKQGHGKILNTSSVRGWQYGGNGPVYAASKAAINNFTSTLAKKLAPSIHVNAVAPGFVETEQYATRTAEEMENYRKRTRLNRLIQPSEIADTFVFLAKNDAITGQVLYVDAGFMLNIK